MAGDGAICYLNKSGYDQVEELSGYVSVCVVLSFSFLFQVF